MAMAYDGGISLNNVNSDLRGVFYSGISARSNSNASELIQIFSGLTFVDVVAPESLESLKPLFEFSHLSVHLQNPYL